MWSPPLLKPQKREDFSGAARQGNKVKFRPFQVQGGVGRKTQTWNWLGSLHRCWHFLYQTWKSLLWNSILFHRHLELDLHHVASWDQWCTGRWNTIFNHLTLLIQISNLQGSRSCVVHTVFQSKDWKGGMEGRGGGGTYLKFLSWKLMPDNNTRKELYTFFLKAILFSDV